MKVILFNGSRRENGCTYTALNIVANQLKAAGIETKIVFVGSTKPRSSWKRRTALFTVLRFITLLRAAKC